MKRRNGVNDAVGRVLDAAGIKYSFVTGGRHGRIVFEHLGKERWVVVPAVALRSQSAGPGESVRAAYP